MKKLCLNVGCGLAENPPTEFEAEWVRLDANPEAEPDVLHDIHQRLPEQHRGVYDVVFCSHMLEHVSWRAINMVFNHLIEATKPDGQILLVVPDIEWACKQVVMGRYNEGVLGVLYGGQQNEWDFHKVGYTPKLLEQLCSDMGLKIVFAERQPFMALMDGKEFFPQQILIIAVREDGKP